MRLVLPCLLILIVAITGCQRMRDMIQDGGGELQPGKMQQKFVGRLGDCHAISAPLPEIFCPFHSDDGVDGNVVFTDAAAMGVKHPEVLLGHNEHVALLGTFDVHRTSDLLKAMDPNRTNQALRHQFILYVDASADVKRLDFEPPGKGWFDGL